MRSARPPGHFLVELVLILPVILFIAFGGYTLCRTACLRSACRSLAQAVNLREGRRQAVRDASVGRVQPADLYRASRKTSVVNASPVLPAPIPGMSGATTSEIRWSKRWEEAGAFAAEMSTDIACSTTAHADCWDGSTASGRRVRAVVGAAVASGVLR